ncbi:hypothetical protein [Paractinoplanes rishiriensis]|nr:hypothetical protein [Actinoplanes rishiriensis]
MSLGVRSAIAYHGPVAVAWLLLTGAYTFLAALHAVAALAVVLVLFMAVAFWCFLLVLNAEDCWNNYRRQKRLAATFGALLLGTLASGVGFGWWLTA